MSVAGGSQLLISCLVCDEKVWTWRGDIRVECRCGAEYHARSEQLAEQLRDLLFRQTGRGCG